jgi:hypothetical protein
MKGKVQLSMHFHRQFTKLKTLTIVHLEKFPNVLGGHLISMKMAPTPTYRRKIFRTLN